MSHLHQLYAIMLQVFQYCTRLVARDSQFVWNIWSHLGRSAKGNSHISSECYFLCWSLSV